MDYKQKYYKYKAKFFLLAGSSNDGPCNTLCDDECDESDRPCYND